jgi:cytochrome c peroxidase
MGEHEMNQRSRLLLFTVMATLMMTAMAPLSWSKDFIPPPMIVRSVFGKLKPVVSPPNNPMTAAKVVLGERLFKDPRLSGDGTVSCESCHRENNAFTVAAPLSPAFTSQVERRNAPSLINVGYAELLLWDGRVEALDEQPVGSLSNVLHLNSHPDLAVEQIKADGDYVAAFAIAFGDDAITPKRLGQAIGAYERTLIYRDSPFDRYMAGDTDALSDFERRGLGVFMKRGRCIACHNGPHFSDGEFHNIGVPDGHITSNPRVMEVIRFDAKRRGYESWADLNEDPGRALVTHDPDDIGRFRTQDLHNIADTAPYMHNGAYPTLEEVVAHYNRGGGDHPNQSGLINRLKLTEDEQAQLVAFLKTLSGTRQAWPLP